MTELNQTVEEKTVPEQSSDKVLHLTQWELNDIAKGVRLKTEERVLARERARLEAEYEEKVQKSREELLLAAREESRKTIQETRDKEIEEQNKRQQIEAHEKIRNKLEPVFKEAPNKISDFNDIVGQYDWNNNEQLQKLIPLLAQEDIDNADEVLRDICLTGKVVQLAHSNVAYAMKELKSISTSLKNSKEKSINSLPDPIKPLRPSHVKTKGDGDLTIEDFRKASWLKC